MEKRVIKTADLSINQPTIVDVPEGEIRFTTNGIPVEKAIKNFETIFPKSKDYVRQNGDKLKCLVDWGNGPEWVRGDVITQLRGVDNPLYMFTPIDRSIIESPEWAVKNPATGEMYKPAAFGIKVMPFTAETAIPEEFTQENARSHYGTYVFMYNGEPRVMDLESIKMGKVEGSPLVGKILIEGAFHRELYAITAKVFDKKNAYVYTKQ